MPATSGRRGLDFLGLALDPGTDGAAVDSREGDVSAVGALARTVVRHSRKDLVSARQVRDALARA